jgi:predicted branched-subunit amino acid permease
MEIYKKWFVPCLVGGALWGLFKESIVAGMIFGCVLFVIEITIENIKRRKKSKNN